MSRSNYSEDTDNWALIKWRGQVTSAIRGKRGQLFLRELISALESLPTKRLIADNLKTDGEFCALGAIAHKRGLEIDKFDIENTEPLAQELNIADQLAREIVFENDEAVWGETPEKRWERMRAWAKSHIEDAGKVGKA